MASSDDEGDTFPDAISDYIFYNKYDEPLSFSKLPVQWNDNGSLNANSRPIFLGGFVDNGLRKFYHQVKAWKYDMLTAIPEISVLSKDNHWIKLEKPKKSYEHLIRTILISVHCLCFLKSKPEASGKSLWNHLSRVFSLYDVNPSENDLIDHISFIREAVKRDETLAKSEFLATFLDNPRKRKSHDEDVKPSFIVDEMQDDDILTNQTEDSNSDEEDDNFDCVCAICDNGGALTCCEGECFRSFHATPDCEAQDVMCESLGLTSKEVEDLKHQEFKCENCKYSLHQCFVCAELGSSDKSSNTEVFRCCSATCGHFYHPRCVAKLLQRNDKAQQQALKDKIAAGEPFICPAHKCAVCKQTENENVEDLQFATCRRCPKSYHRKCLPSDLIFDHQSGNDDDDDDDDYDYEVRAWNGLLSKSRALIYCVEHKIDPELGTPARSIIFKNVRNRKAQQDKKKVTVKLTYAQQDKKKVTVKLTYGDLEVPSKKSVLKSQKAVEKSSAIKPEGASKKRASLQSYPEPSKKKKVADTSKTPLSRNFSTEVEKLNLNDGHPTFGSRLSDWHTETISNNLEKDDTPKTPLRRNFSTGFEKLNLNDGQPTFGSRLSDWHTETISNNLEKDGTSVHYCKQAVVAKSQETEILPSLDEKSKQRILALRKEAASFVTFDEVKRYHQEKVPSTHAFSSRVDKTIILARVEGAVEAINLAVKKLKEGCSVEDVKAICEPGVIDQLMRWKNRLKVYLAPFLHGTRYTSFGRHFTKVEKLEKIVDKLQWYIEDGDMVVDFCCGANDFSCLMKERLDEMGKKKCLYKNYDITQPKNDFNFEKRDWMTVSPKELPSGSRLIMGLNPPFGMNSALAKKFIDKAILFKPKLIILIVPSQTQRLDSEKRRFLYDLVWEDSDLLAGKSFYLPGSVDENGKQVDQWNKIAPPLYLWSRPDWTNKHMSIAQKHGHWTDKRKSIAQKHGHIPRVQEQLLSDENEPALGFPVGNRELEQTTHKAKRTDDEEENTYQNSSKYKRHGQESKVDKHDDRDWDANNQNHAWKPEKTQAPVDIQKHENGRVPSHEPWLTRYGPKDRTYNRTNTSATQWYALDELNKTSSGQSELEGMNRARISGVGRPEPLMGSRHVGGHGPPLNGLESPMDSLGFARGPGQ